MRRGEHNQESGTTLPELMIAAVVIGIFFTGIFEVSTICLRYISSSKENISAIECVQDRLEQFRGMDMASLTDQTYLAVAPTPPPASPSPSAPQRRNLTTPANESPLAQQATEIVKISTYANGAATTPSVTYTRGPGAVIKTTPFSDTNVLPSVTWSGGSSFPTPTPGSLDTRVLQVDVTYTWNAVLGRRTRSETSSTIIAAGTKK